MAGISGLGTGNVDYTSEAQRLDGTQDTKQAQQSSSSTSEAKSTGQEDEYVDTSAMVDDTLEDDSYTYYKDGRKASHSVTDKDGETKEVKYNYDSDKKYAGKTVTKGDKTTEYNSENKKVSSTKTYTNDDGVQLTENREYDENGKTKTRTIKNSKGEVIQEDSNYVYNKDGKVESKTVTKNGKSETRTYTYDKNGKKATMNNGNKTVYYDSEGNKTKSEREYTRNGEKYTEIIKYGKNGKTESKTIKDKDGKTVSKHKDYSYDKNGKLESKTITKNGKTKQIEYTRDKDGNLKTRTVKDKDGKVLKEYTYSDYETDDKGKTTRKVEIKDEKGNTIGYKKQFLGENGKSIENINYDKDHKAKSRTYKDENGQVSRVLKYGSWERGEDGTRTRKCEIKNANGDIVGYRIDTKDKDGNITRDFQNSKGKESKKSAIMYD